MNQHLSRESKNCWIELSDAAIRNNVQVFKSFLQPNQKLLCVVKANAYGHGMVQVATAAVTHGADWLGVFSVEEGAYLREAGINAPILVLGPSFGEQYQLAGSFGLRVTIGSVDALAEYISIVRDANVPVHLKLETGTNRQGILYSELEDAAQRIVAASVDVEGAYTHYADIEDTTDHSFAAHQQILFAKSIAKLASCGVEIRVPHTACTAAAILFPKTYFKMVRVGIGTYGLWPSKETHVSAHGLGRDQLQLAPVMAWKTRIAQIKQVPMGEYVGYGRTFRATRNMKIAILPVGYADGYSRHFSNSANTLVRGMRARVVGRVCMNLTMIDVTDIADVTVGDVVTLLGCDGDECVSAEQLAGCAGTINYEIVTCAAPNAPRRLV